MLFGESVAGDVELGLTVGYARAVMYDMNRFAIEAKLEAVREGDVNKWLLDLTPEVAPYLAALRAYYESPLLACRDSAARMGREVWGVKYPRWPPHIIELLRADPEAFLRRVEEHSGARPIDRAVLTHKVNDSSGYIAPAELTPEELAIVEQSEK